jgi:hypothetical protein
MRGMDMPKDVETWLDSPTLGQETGAAEVIVQMISWRSVCY